MTNDTTRSPAVAQQVLNDALRAISTDRPNTHGDARLNFECISDFWNLYDSWLAKMGRKPDASDAAIKMSLFKVARMLTGDRSHADHYVDEIGYAALAASLAGVKPSSAITLPRTTMTPSSAVVSAMEEAVRNATISEGRANSLRPLAPVRE